MCKLLRSSWLSRSISVVLLVMSLSGAYSRLCPEECICLFNEYRCANVTIRTTTFSFITLTCKVINISCTDLPKLDLQCMQFAMYDCPASILTCLSDSLGLYLPSMQLLQIHTPYGFLKAEHLRDFKNLQSLQLNFDNDTPIPIPLINTLKDLKYLLVFGGNLRLPDNRFNSTSLQNIYLRKTGMDRFITEVFNGLPNLETLRLKEVQIENICVGFLKGLDSLKMLSLQQNNLKFIEEGVFASTPKLKLLNIINNPLLSLPVHLFNGLASLEALQIKVFDQHYNNNILFQRSETFVQQPVCLNRHLDDFRTHSPISSYKNTISSASINAAYTEWNGRRRQFNCSPLIFTNLTSLKSLELLNISISVLSDVMFTNVQALKTLNLKDNKIKELPKNVFHGLAALKKIDLSSNNIKILKGGIFSNLSALDVLDLSNNAIEELTINAFNGLKKLTRLNLRNNNIVNIEVATDQRGTYTPFKNLPTLQEIDLSHNNINRIGDNLCFEMRHIRVINLAYNHFNNIQEFYEIGILEGITLNLSFNNISEINLRQELYIVRPPPSNPSLLIYLDHNPLFCDCNNYDLLVCAKGIVPCGNIKLLLGNSTCSGPSHLKRKLVIEISLNDLVCDLPIVCPNNCTCMFRPASSEIIFDCNEMPTKLPAFIDIISYDILSINDYKLNYTLNLKSQTDNLADLDINTLNLSNTYLYNITFKPNDHLKTLDVSHNTLTTIPNAILSTNITLYVADNPLHCDCALVEQLKENRVADFRLVYCANGEALSEINVSRLCAWKTVLFGYICLAMMAVIFIIKMAITMYRYVKRKRFTISRMLFRRGSEFSINLERNLDIVKDYDLFISFAHQDTEFVKDNLLPKLENEFSQSVCVHHRDWIAGELIEDQIIQSVESARRTVIILTEAFITSEWSYLEFRTAHNMSIREGRPRVIIILLEEEIVKDERLSKEIKSYTSVNTYLVWSDPDFWKKLQRILPNHGRR